MEQHGIPGVSLAVVHDQEVAWTKGFGFADLKSAHPMHEETLFGVASITKTFTVGAIMQLRDDGKLDLADPNPSSTASSRSVLLFSIVGAGGSRRVS